VAVVTGSAQGLGKGIAEKLGENGFKVVLSDINEEVLNETLEELKGKGYDVIAKVADVSKRSDHEALIEATVDAFVHINAYINNAGVEGAVEKFENITEEDITSELDVNVKVVFYGIQAAATQLKKQGQGGTIINTSSIADHEGFD